MNIVVTPSLVGIIVLNQALQPDRAVTRKLKDRRVITTSDLSGMVTFQPILLVGYNRTPNAYAIIRSQILHDNRIVWEHVQPQLHKIETFLPNENLFDLPMYSQQRNIVGLWKLVESISLMRRQEFDRLPQTVSTLQIANRRTAPLNLMGYLLTRVGYTEIASFSWRILLPTDQQMDQFGNTRRRTGNERDLRQIEVSLDDL